MTDRRPCESCGVMTEYDVGETLCSSCADSYAFAKGTAYATPELQEEFIVVDVEDGDAVIRFRDGDMTKVDADDLDEKVRTGEVVSA
jgi:uncharacterized protein CbrC (UPF0167 family)